MSTVRDVIRFENAIGKSTRLIYDASNAFSEFNSHVDRIESAMMEEFNCSQSELKHLNKDAELGPKAEASLAQGFASGCFGDPLTSMKATALTVDDCLHEWLKTAKEKGATHIVVAHDGFFYDDFPIYVHSLEEAKIEEEKLNKESGVYFVRLVHVN